ncbi:MAG: hypothetical protein H7Y07_06250 [Pyrinomonadaceae bacterium]|nr:hypothetical protein [Sphingobacteriaceae bacterium]
MYKYVFLALITISIASCSPKIITKTDKTYPALGFDKEVVVIALSDNIPSNAIEIGVIKIKDNGLSLNCSWNAVIEKAKTEARKIGGNGLKITQHTPPNLLSSCHQITATVLKINNTEIIKDEPPKAPPITVKPKANTDYNRFTIGAHGGWSYMTAKISKQVPADFKQYIRELKSGYHFGGDVSYNWSEQMGAGLKYSNFRTQNMVQNITATDNTTGQTRTGRLQDDVSIHFIGPAYYNKFVSRNKKTVISSGLSIGYLSYKNNGVIIDNFILTGNTIGFAFDFGVDAMLSKELGLGFKFANTSGSLSELEKNDGRTTQSIKLKDDQRESISRIDLSIGLKYYFYPSKK